MYNLVWEVNGVVKETLETNKPKTICLWRKGKLKNTTHKLGLLKIIKTK